MSSFFALLEQVGRNATILMDDVVALSKPALSRAGDVVALSKPAVGKASAVVVDDTAVCSDQLGESAIAQHREYAVWAKIVGLSLFNKVALTALIIGSTALMPVLPEIMLGFGAGYLAYEGAHKVAEYGHALRNKMRALRGLPALAHAEEEANPAEVAPASPKARFGFMDRFFGHDPKERAVLTDLGLLDAILSTEILLIAKGSMGGVSLGMQALALGVVSLATTLGVYGVVLGIIRADNVAEYFNHPQSRFYAPRLAKGIMKALPHVLKVIGVVGTVAMLGVAGEVGGHLLPQAAEALGASGVAHGLHAAFEGLASSLGFLPFGAETLGAMVAGGVIGAGLIASKKAIHAAACGVKRCFTVQTKQEEPVLCAATSADSASVGCAPQRQCNVEPTSQPAPCCANESAVQTPKSETAPGTIPMRSCGVPGHKLKKPEHD